MARKTRSRRFRGKNARKNANEHMGLLSNTHGVTSIRSQVDRNGVYVSWKKKWDKK